MYCGNCGAQIDEGDKFCRICGCGIYDVDDEQTTVLTAPPQGYAGNNACGMPQNENDSDSGEEPKKKINWRIPVIIALSVVILALTGTVIWIIFLRYDKNEKPDTTEKELTESAAVEPETEGIEKEGSSEEKETDEEGMYEDYVQNTLVYEYGTAPTEKTEASISIVCDSGVATESWLEFTGVASYYISDFDGDGKKELVVIVYKMLEYSQDEQGYVPYMQLYEINDEGEVSQLDDKALSLACGETGENARESAEEGILSKENMKTFAQISVVEQDGCDYFVYELHKCDLQYETINEYYCVAQVTDGTIDYVFTVKKTQYDGMGSNCTGYGIEDGKISSEILLYSSDPSKYYDAKYTDYDVALVEFFDDYGFTVTHVETEWNVSVFGDNDVKKRIFNQKIDGKTKYSTTDYLIEADVWVMVTADVQINSVQNDNDAQSDTSEETSETGKKARNVADSGGQWPGDFLELREAYADLVQEYYDAYTKYCDGDGLDYSTYAYASSTDNQPGYLLYDMNDDGVDEMFVGLYYAAEDNFVIYGVYTYQESAKLVIGVSDLENYLSLTEDGLIYDFLGDPPGELAHYYSLQAGGSELEFVDGVGFDYDMNYYRISSDNSLSEITEDEYYQITNSHPESHITPVISNSDTIAQLREGD